MHPPTAAESSISSGQDEDRRKQGSQRRQRQRQEPSQDRLGQPAGAEQAAPGTNRSATTPANGAASGGITSANSSSPTAVALPMVRCTYRINAVVAIASPSRLMV